MADHSRTGRKSAIVLIQADSLARLAWLVHGFTTRTGGSSKPYGGRALNLGFTSRDSPAAVEANRRALAAHLAARWGKTSWPLVTLRQIHSDLIH
ncbi:MAG: laccase domain-containing protein, partial [Acidobacteria bacterium]|nr:laccase domain-containing protein [Acidobacteriota bacterium]